MINYIDTKTKENLKSFLNCIDEIIKESNNLWEKCEEENDLSISYREIKEPEYQVTLKVIDEVKIIVDGIYYLNMNKEKNNKKVKYGDKKAFFEIFYSNFIKNCKLTSSMNIAIIKIPTVCELLEHFPRENHEFKS